MRKTGRVVVGLLLIAVVVLLPGCVRVPTSGPVIRVDGQQQSCQNCVNVEVAPPSPGDEPREVVDGFLRANAYYQPSYSVAREYLTRESGQSWKPESGVTVYEASTTVEGDAVSLRGNVVGRVAADRSYVAAREGLKQVFTLARQDGEWRIDKPPDGLLVPSWAVALNYMSYDLFFLASGQPGDEPGAVRSSVLVPDPIYLPKFRSPDNVASALVKALLNGPTSWLKPAVSTAIPTGTTLSVDSVTINNGVASVPLSDAVLSLPDAQRSQLAAQIVYTLKEALAVRGVAITVNQQGFQVPGSDPSTFVVPTAGVSPELDPVSPNLGGQLYVVRDGKVAVVDASSGELRPFGGDLGRDPVRSIGVSVTDTELVAVTAGGTRLVQVVTGGSGTRARLVLTGATGLLRPQFTRFGELWTVGEEDGRQRLWRVGTAPVRAPQLEGRDITAFRFSPDGVRVAFVERTGDTQRLLIGRVMRGDGVDIDGVREIDTQHSQPRALTHFADVGWLDATHLLVLGASTGKEAPGPYSVSEDGSSLTNQGQTLSWYPVEVAVPLRTQSAVIRSQDQQTWRNVGTTWTPFVDHVQAVAYPG